MKTYDGINSILNSLDFEKPKNHVYEESESRSRLMRFAKEMKCEKELALIFAKYDTLLKNCANEGERKHISILGIAEVNKLMSFKGSCVVGGVEIGSSDNSTEEK